MLSTAELASHAPARRPSSTGSNSSALRRGSSAALKKLRKAAFTPATNPSSAPPSPPLSSMQASPSALPHPSAPRVLSKTPVAPVLNGIGDERRARAAVRRPDLCTPSAAVEEILAAWKCDAEFEMSVAVGCGVFGGVDYSKDGDALTETESEEGSEEFTDCPWGGYEWFVGLLQIMSERPVWPTHKWLVLMKSTLCCVFVARASFRIVLYCSVCLRGGGSLVNYQDCICPHFM